MILQTNNYQGRTVREVMASLGADTTVTEFIRAYNLPGGDVIERIATKMVYDDPATVDVDETGRVQ